MFRRIDANGYRSLKSISQSLGPFEILVGANGSGKSSFLDVIAFLSTLVSDGLDAAVDERTKNFHDLVWGRNGDCFKLAVEALIPEDKRLHDPQTTEILNVIRYEVGVRIDTATERLHIESETARVYLPGGSHSGIQVLEHGDNAHHFTRETDLRGFDIDQRSQNYPGLRFANSSGNPALTWLYQTLREGIKFVALNVEDLRKASPPAQSEKKEIHGSSFARSVAQLVGGEPMRFHEWLAHVRTAIPEIKDIRTVLREDDKHRYVVVKYRNGIDVPSWMVSDGTLRLLALTALAYLPGFTGSYLIEEPENGVHPTALETIYQSLSSIYEAQVLIASQSPLLLGMASPQQLLCFSQSRDGTRIIRGNEHPALQDWQREVSLGTMMASGILG
jgi:predicted ATPase